jgi:hypothetical protein
MKHINQHKGNKRKVPFGRRLYFSQTMFGQIFMGSVT